MQAVIALSMLLFGKHCNLNFINVSNINYFNHLFSCYHGKVTFQPIKKNILLKAINKYKHLNRFKEFVSFTNSNVFYRHDYIEVCRFTNEGFLGLFKKRKFKISINLRYFNGFIHLWNLENAESTSGMFYSFEFNQHQLEFNLPSLRDAANMFYDASFSKNFIAHNTKKLINVNYMFFSSNLKGFIHIDLSNAYCLDNLFLSNLFMPKIKNIVFPKKLPKYGCAKYIVHPST